MLRSVVRCGLLAVAVTCAGCASSNGDPSPSGDAGTAAPEIFIAQLSDFVGFCHWSNAVATAPGDAGDGIHGLGPLRVYWNQSPPHGSTSFPVGTIIVKESQQSDPSQRVAFAMVKRGAGYNAGPGGAVGWEWFSLQDQGDCSFGTTPLWRDPAPPIGESYAGMPVGDCNGCHSLVSDNDYVWDTALSLSHF
jgi:hypothetical protein